MLEHADRHDAVETAGDVAIILEPEDRILRPAALDRALLRARVLLLRERDAGDVRAGDLGKIERKAAPAAADVEHRCARLDTKLGGEVALLGELGVVERLVRSFEIGAAILLVGVEEERIEPAVEVVVMRDIAPRARARIELLQAAEQVAPEPPAAAPIAVMAMCSCRNRSASTSAIEPCSTTNVPSM